MARSDPSGFLATPVETVKRGRGDLARIQAIAEEIAAESTLLEVVVGLPRSLRVDRAGGENPATAKVCPTKLCRRSTMNQPIAPATTATTATIVPARSALSMKWNASNCRASSMTFQLNPEPVIAGCRSAGARPARRAGRRPRADRCGR